MGGLRMKKLPIFLLSFVAFLTTFDLIMGSSATTTWADERIQSGLFKRSPGPGLQRVSDGRIRMLKRRYSLPRRLIETLERKKERREDYEVQDWRDNLFPVTIM